MKRRETVREDIPEGSSLEDRDAATTLSKLLHGFPPPWSSEPRHQSWSQSLKWIGTRKRSIRVRRVDSSSEDVNPTTSNNPPQQGSECASSPVGDSQSVVTLVNAEEEPCSSEEERCLGADLRPNKLPSDSSNASPESESPTSPLPTTQTSELISKFAESLSGRSSAFQKTVLRPVKKPKVCRKLKVEEIIFESLNREPATISFVPEPGPVKFDPATIKVESRLSGRPGQRIGGKPKPALSESEKEARKQRRVQANRESARQTIRRKQELCEDLLKRAQHLALENETIRKEVEIMHLTMKSFVERNAYLRNQVEKCATAREPGSTLNTPSSVETLSLVQFPFSHAFSGVGLRTPYLWPSTLPKSADSIGPVAGEMNAPLATAFANNGATFWIGGSTQGQIPLMPPFFSNQQISSAGRNLPVASADIPATFCPLTRTVSLPVISGQPSCLLAPTPSATERALLSSKTLAMYRSGNFGDSSQCPLELKKTDLKCETISQESIFNSRTHMFNSATQSGMTATTVMMHKLGEGGCLPAPKMPRQLLSRAQSLGTSHMPKILNSSFTTSNYTLGMLLAQERPSMRESDAQRAAAAATEARRRRKELTRTKSLQVMHQRQGARLAEPPAS